MSCFLLLWYCLSFYYVMCRPLYVLFPSAMVLPFILRCYIDYLFDIITLFVVSRIKPLSTIFQLYRGVHRSTVGQYCSLSYIYLCNKCLSSTKVAGSILIMSRCTRHNILVSIHYIICNTQIQCNILYVVYKPCLYSFPCLILCMSFKIITIYVINQDFSDFRN